MTVTQNVQNALIQIAKDSKLTASAVTSIALDALTLQDQQNALFTRVWSADGKSADYRICGYSFTITELSNGTYSCTPISCVTFFQDGKRNERASMKERADSKTGLPTDHDTALRNAITRINGSIRNVLDDRETTQEASARKSNAHTVVLTQKLTKAQEEALAKDKQIAELQAQIAKLSKQSA